MDIFALFMSFFVKPTPPEEKKVEVAPIVVETHVENVEKTEKIDVITPKGIIESKDTIKDKSLFIDKEGKIEDAKPIKIDKEGKIKKETAK